MTTSFRCRSDRPRVFTESSTFSKDTTQAYHRMAPRYDSRWHRYMEEVFDRALRYMEGQDPLGVLDVGCGTGEFFRRLRARFPEAFLVGVDPAAGMIEAARRKFGSDSQVSFQCVPAEALTFREGQFDGVISLNAFHCFRDTQTAVGEMARVLRPGGRFLVVDWCRDAWVCRLFDRWCRWFDPAHARMYTAGELRRMAESQGIRVIRIDRFRVAGPGRLRLWEMMACLGEKLPGGFEGSKRTVEDRMRKRRRYPVVGFALAMALGAVAPVVLLAAEHGGKEHGGAPVAAKEHGGTTSTAASHEGSHGMEMDEAALLKEAATALRKGQSRPDLAEKLERLAKSHSPR